MDIIIAILCKYDHYHWSSSLAFTPGFHFMPQPLWLFHKRFHLYGSYQYYIVIHYLAGFHAALLAGFHATHFLSLAGSFHAIPIADCQWAFMP